MEEKYHGKHILVLDESTPVILYEAVDLEADWDEIVSRPRAITGGPYPNLGRAVETGYFGRMNVTLLVPDRNSDIAAITVLKCSGSPDNFNLGVLKDGSEIGSIPTSNSALDDLEQSPSVSIGIVPKQREKFRDNVTKYGLLNDNFISGVGYKSPQAVFIIKHMEKLHGRRLGEPTQPLEKMEIIHSRTKANVAHNTSGEKAADTYKDVCGVLMNENILSPDPKLNKFLVGIIQAAAGGGTLELRKIEGTLDVFDEKLGAGRKSGRGGRG